MKSKLYFLLLVALLIQPVLLAQNKLPGIKGSWDSDIRSHTGVGSVWVFKEDGKFQITSAAMMDYLYVVYNDTLVTVYIDKQTAKAIPDTSIIKINGDTLTQTYISGKKRDQRTFKRVGKLTDGKNVERGSWEGKNSAGQEMTYKFTKDHQLIFRVPFKTVTGTYELKGTDLKTKLNGQKEQRWKVRFINMTMVLSNETSGSEIAFERSK